MQKTTHYNLNKPDVTDFYNIEHFNTNADMLDEVLHGHTEDIIGLAGTTLTATLTAGQTSLVFNNPAITDLSTIDMYTSVFGVNPTDAVAENGTLTLTFKAQSADVNVKVVIR